MITLTVNGVSYQYPETDDNEWGDDATAWAQSVSQNTLQKNGGNFTLTSEVNFGPSYGIEVRYLKNQTFAEHGHAALPATPAASKSRMFFFTDGAPKYVQPSGVVVPIVPKVYRIGTAYTNGTPTVTMSATTPATQFSSLMPYRTTDGSTRIRIEAWFSHDSVTANDIVISGITFVNGVGAVNVGGAVDGYGYFDGAGIHLSFASSYGYSSVFIDAEISAWPTWAD